MKRLLLLVVIVATAVAIAFTTSLRSLDPHAVMAAVEPYRHVWWAAAVYLVAYAICDVLFIPTQALSIAAVVLWGWMLGGTIELLSATLGALLPFLIGRTTLRDWLAAKIARHERVATLLDEEGFSLLLVLRLVPIIPYTPLNYVASLSTITIRRYLAATFLGMIPSTFIFAYFVDALLRGLLEPRAVALRVVGAGLLLGALVVATRLASRRTRSYIFTDNRRGS